MAGAAGDSPQLEILDCRVAVAQVILDYRAHVVYLHAPSVWKMQCRENGVVSTVETHLDFVVITCGDHDVGNLRGKHQALQFCMKGCCHIRCRLVSWCEGRRFRFRGKRQQKPPCYGWLLLGGRCDLSLSFLCSRYNLRKGIEFEY